MRNLDEKVKLIDIQLTGSILFVCSLIVTIVLTYNQRQYTLNRKPLFTYKQTYIISTLNRVLVLLIVLSFLYTSYEFREIAIYENSDVELNDLDVFASILTVISAIIVLYITASSSLDTVLDIENPNV